MIEDDLRATFTARAADHSTTPDLADQVIARATTIRRRRTVTAAAISTAAAALIGFLAIAPGDPAATELPVATPRPAPVAFGAHHVLLSDGTELKLSDTPLRQVIRVNTGWVVATERTASFVPDDGAPRQLGPTGGYVHVTVNREGTKVAVQTSDDADTSQVHAYALPSGTLLGSARPDGWTANRWVGDWLVISAHNGDAGPVAVGFWDGTDAQQRLTGSMLILGPSRGDLIAAVPNGDGTCLVRLNTELTETDRTCDIGFRFGDRPPDVSPDGRHLIAEIGGQHVSIDVAQAFSGRTVRVPLDVTVDSLHFGWVSTTEVLFQTADSVVRCSVTGPCEPHTLPTVAGAPAEGLVPLYPDLR